MVIAGPEEPLVKGACDFLKNDSLKHIHFIGPSQFSAQLEGSKAFAKAFIQKTTIFLRLPTKRFTEKF